MEITTTMSIKKTRLSGSAAEEHGWKQPQFITADNSEDIFVNRKKK
jgi:hypothetical protein